MKLTVVNPATEEPIDELTQAGVKETDAAVARAKAQHRETVASFVDGNVVFRGEVPSGPGYLYPATLVEARNDDRIAGEEIFGPIAFGRELGMHALEGYSEVENVFLAT
jgi:acyl-CoA reductase-like NAD-dependent aldehyde dehydrogenase